MCRRQGEGECPGKRLLRLSDETVELEGDPVRLYQYRDEKLTLPAECNFPIGADKPTANAPVYVQDVRAVLHFSPSFNGQLENVLPIGAECTSLSAKRGDWLELQCGKNRGFVLSWQVSTKPPDAEMFRKRAADAKLPIAQRLNYALRVLALSQQDEPALKEFAASYLSIRSQEYARTRGGEDERVLVCPAVAKAMGHTPFASAQECLAAEFRRAEYNWDLLRFDGKRFLRIVRRAKWLEEDSGYFSGDGSSVKVTLVTRKWFGEPGVLEKALVLQAERPAPGAKFDGARRPILDPGSLSQIARLPKQWITVTNKNGFPVIEDSMCEIREHKLDWDLNGVATMLWASAQESDLFFITRYGIDNKMTILPERHGEDTSGAETRAFEWRQSDYGRGFGKVAEVEAFSNGRRVTLAPSDKARTLPLENEDSCVNGQYMGPSPYNP